MESIGKNKNGNEKNDSKEVTRRYLFNIRRAESKSTYKTIMKYTIEVCLLRQTRGMNTSIYSRYMYLV